MSTSAVEILARQSEVEQAMRPYFHDLAAWGRVFAVGVFKQYERSVRRAPCTDDMWQMLADMGIEPAPRRFSMRGPFAIVGLRP